MAEYYLISQLPSLDGIGENTPLPITFERFIELCGDHLGKKAQFELKNMTLTPKRDFESSDSALLCEWNRRERDLRLALAKTRAEKMQKTFDTGDFSPDPETVETAGTAVGMTDPMEAEKYLNGYRMELLESLRPSDGFSLDYVYYYGLRLMLMQRARRFDAGAGKTAYKNIYDSVLNGDGLEDRI